MPKFYAPVPVSTLPAKRTKMADPSFFERTRRTMKGIGKKIVKGTGTVVKKGIKFGTYGALAAGGLYLAGGSSRRYEKAPKVGEDRDLRDTIVSMGYKDYY